MTWLLRLESWAVDLFTRLDNWVTEAMDIEEESDE